MTHETWWLAGASGLSILLLAGCGLPGTPCGGESDLACATGSFCKYETGCGETIVAGICEAIPDVCTDIYAPVCGCDGETYASDCVAWGNSINIATEGECEQAP